MAFENVKSRIVGVEAAADLSAHQYKFMVVNASGQIALNTSAGGEVDGVLQNKPSAQGEAAEVAIGDVLKVKCGAAVTAGDLVMSDASGLAVTATSTNFAVGRALSTTANSGEFVSVLMNFYGNV